MAKTETLIIPGPAGQLEAVWNEAGVDFTHKTAALICHPHPLFDGTMHNKVVSTLIRTFAAIGVPSMKFNFRGVGGSEGSYGEGAGETQDAQAVLQWLQKEQGIERFYLAGFSFGSYVAANLARQLAPEQQALIQQLIMVAPAVQKFDFSELFPADYETLVVVSDADEVVPPDEVYHWLDTQYPPLPLLEMPGASHFFHGRLTELKTKLTERLVKL